MKTPPHAWIGQGPPPEGTAAVWITPTMADRWLDEGGPGVLAELWARAAQVTADEGDAWARRIARRLRARFGATRPGSMAHCATTLGLPTVADALQRWPAGPAPTAGDLARAAAPDAETLTADTRLLWALEHL